MRERYVIFYDTGFARKNVKYLGLLHLLHLKVKVKVTLQQVAKAQRGVEV
jgi:hypothetical protein